MTLFGSRVSIPRFATAVTVGMLALATAACAPSGGAAPKAGSDAPVTVGEGDAQAGRKILVDKGCGACHTVRGVPEATGQIGPALTGIAGRPKIADTLPNSPENMKRWITNPPAVKPGTTMPSLGLSNKEADDLVAFLGTLK
jgi:cytochrome c